MPALPAPGPGEAVGEDAALQIAAKLPLHIFRHRPQVIVNVAALGEPGLEVLLDAAVEHALARTARPIPRSCALPGPALDPHPCPLGPALWRWGSGWAARCAGRHWLQGLGRAAKVSWLNTRRRRGMPGAGRLVNGCFFPANWDVRATVWNWPARVQSLGPRRPKPPFKQFKAESLACPYFPEWIEYDASSSMR